MILLNELSMFAQCGSLIHQVTRGVNSEKKYFQNYYLIRFLIFGAYRSASLSIRSAKNVTEIYAKNQQMVSLVNEFLKSKFSLPDQCFIHGQDFTRFSDGRGLSTEEMDIISQVRELGMTCKLSEVLALGFCSHQKFIKSEHGMHDERAQKKDKKLSRQFLGEFLYQYCRAEVTTNIK